MRRRRTRNAFQTTRRRTRRERESAVICGIDADVEKIFLNLCDDDLVRVFRRYGEIHGHLAMCYAQRTYDKWKSGKQSVSGMIAERLLQLVPPVLNSTVRFELVKKLRTANMQKQHRSVTCSSSDWQAFVKPMVDDLVRASSRFELPAHVLSRVTWLADGDTAMVHQLLAAAEEDEARARLKYLDAEFARIDTLISQIEARTTLEHTIQIPQGTLHISIDVFKPPRAWRRAKESWGRLQDALRETRRRVVKARDRSVELVKYFIEHEL